MVPPPSGFNNNTSEIATMLQLGMHGGSLAARVIQPLPGSNTLSYSNGSRSRVPWSQQEYE
ncbi:hypothetical protein RYX36_025292 [Vicia faba]